MKKLLALVIVTALSAVPTAALAATKTATLSVPGMTCPLCPLTVKKALSDVKGVSRVEVNFDRKEATVMFDETKTNIEALRKATADAGYPASVKP